MANLPGGKPVASATPAASVKSAQPTIASTSTVSPVIAELSELFNSAKLSALSILSAEDAAGKLRGQEVGKAVIGRTKAAGKFAISVVIPRKDVAGNPIIGEDGKIKSEIVRIVCTPQGDKINVSSADLYIDKTYDSVADFVDELQSTQNIKLNFGTPAPKEEVKVLQDQTKQLSPQPVGVAVQPVAPLKPAASIASPTVVQSEVAQAAPGAEVKQAADMPRASVKPLGFSQAAKAVTQQTPKLSDQETLLQAINSGNQEKLNMVLLPNKTINLNPPDKQIKEMPLFLAVETGNPIMLERLYGFFEQEKRSNNYSEVHKREPTDYRRQAPQIPAIMDYAIEQLRNKKAASEAPGGDKVAYENAKKISKDIYSHLTPSQQKDTQKYLQSINIDLAVPRPPKRFGIF